MKITGPKQRTLYSRKRRMITQPANAKSLLQALYDLKRVDAIREVHLCSNP
jgi:hypothetical protein